MRLKNKATNVALSVGQTDGRAPLLVVIKQSKRGHLSRADMILID